MQRLRPGGNHSNILFGVLRRVTQELTQYLQLRLTLSLTRNKRKQALKAEKRFSAVTQPQNHHKSRKKKNSQNKATHSLPRARFTSIGAQECHCVNLPTLSRKSSRLYPIKTQPHASEGQPRAQRSQEAKISVVARAYTIPASTRINARLGKAGKVINSVRRDTKRAIVPENRY